LVSWDQRFYDPIAGREAAGHAKRRRVLHHQRLRLELAAFNERIEELEKQHPEASRIEVLRAGALMLARQIDELRCSSADDLTDLLAK
jgi:uncharacterized protein YydD (DUF2326 family)